MRQDILSELVVPDGCDICLQRVWQLANIVGLSSKADLLLRTRIDGLRLLINPGKLG